MLIQRCSETERIAEERHADVGRLEGEKAGLLARIEVLEELNQ